MSDYKNAHSKEEKRELEDYLRQIKGNIRTQISLNDPKLIRKSQLERELNNLMAPQLFAISKKEQAQRDKQAKVLQTKISKIQAEVDEIRDNKIFVGAFEWRIEFPEVLDEDGRMSSAVLWRSSSHWQALRISFRLAESMMKASLKPVLIP